MKRVHTIIVAAGTGSRFGAAMPKQFCLLSGRPVLMHTIDALRLACPGRGLTLVLAAAEMERWACLCREYGFESPQTVAGGATRTASVAAGLAAVPAEAEVIMVHDGARPLVAPEVVQRLLYTLDECRADGALPCVSVTDSLREFPTVPEGRALYTHAVDRSLYVAVQTPQAFPASTLRVAYEKAARGGMFTDDASVVEAAGFGRIAISQGSHRNIKITNPGDIALAEFYLANP